MVTIMDTMPDWFLRRAISAILLMVTALLYPFFYNRVEFGHSAKLCALHCGFAGSIWAGWIIGRWCARHDQQIVIAVSDFHINVPQIGRAADWRDAQLCQTHILADEFAAAWNVLY